MQKEQFLIVIIELIVYILACFLLNELLIVLIIRRNDVSIEFTRTVLQHLDNNI